MSPRAPLQVRFHYGWVVLAVTFSAMLSAAIIRSAISVFIQPMEAEFGWSRSQISTAVSVSLLGYGAASPVLGRLMDRFGARRILLTSLGVMAAGTAAVMAVREIWHLILLWGVVVGLATGGGASVLSAAVANRWFAARRGLALGLLNSAASMGQLALLPVIMALVVHFGWRAGVLALSTLALLVMPMVLWLMRNDPADVGLTPYGAGAPAPAPGAPAPASGTGLVTLREIFSSPTFWLLAGAFFACGATTNGLIGTHLIPHSLEHGISEVTAASAFGVMGAMNFVGTNLSGWLTDRYNPRLLLAAALGLRALTLFMLPLVSNAPSLFAFAVVFGLDWFATVPPIVALTADTFGRRSVTSVFGWIFLSHQLGSALAAISGGVIRDWLGDYQVAFLSAGVVGVLGAMMAFQARPGRRPPSLAHAGD